MNNSQCYRLEQHDFSDGFLDLDATYIIHLEGNGREEHVIKQLEEYHPTNLVYILYNKGYKKCKKSLHLNESKVDLIDAFLYIFKDAKHKNYKNILILEDDFIFNSKIKDKQIQRNVMEFIKKKENEPMIYMLGCLPLLQKPCDKYTNNLSVGIGTHACIYTQSVIEKSLQENVQDITDWDYYTHSKYARYMYHEALCYQLFPETENQKNWHSFYGLTYFLIYIIKILKLDEQPEPGYTFFYNTSKVLYAMVVILAVLFILFIAHLIYVYALKNYNIAKTIKNIKRK
jgi:hypothetical protein